MSTSASRLRELVQAATPGPWHRWGDPLGNPLIRRDDKTTVSLLSWDNAALIALAPELAVQHADLLDWAQDAADGLRACLECHDPLDPDVQALLARLDGLLPEGGE